MVLLHLGSYLDFCEMATSRSYVDWVQVAILELAASAVQCVLAGNHADRLEQSPKRRNTLDKSHFYPDNTITSGYNEALSDPVSHYMLHRICWDQAYRFR